MTAEELARYRRSLDETAARARSYVLRRLSEEGAGLGVAESRDLAIEIVEDATGVFGDQAQEVAAELFDEVMEADGVGARATSFAGLIDHGRTEGKVRRYAGRIVEGDRAGFEARSADLAAYYVHRSAWENLVRNCDLAHVMWARVPTGRETCGWCYTLATRGFAYHTRDSAMAGKHTGCDCVVVPGNAGSEVEGLDLQWMRNCWGDCSDAVGGPLTREQTRELWDALDEGARAELRAKYGSRAYEVFHERKSIEHICAEVERRDAGWLYGQEDRRYPLYSRYNVVETIETSRGPVEVIRYNQANNNKRPELAGRPNAIYATRSKKGKVNNVYFTDADGRIIEEWNCGGHKHLIDGVLTDWHKHIGPNPNHKETEASEMSDDEIEFVKGVDSV